MANWEGLALCEDYQTKGYGWYIRTKGKRITDFKKLSLLRSQPLQKYLAKCVRYSFLV